MLDDELEKALDQDARRKEAQKKEIPEAANKLKKLLKVSKRVRIDLVREYVKMDEERFIEKLVEWAAEFEFKIDGDYIITDGSNVDEFIGSIDAMFARWNDEQNKPGQKL
nr:hypothetical protein [Candidatus Sigynarchaeota archaeon]